MWTAFINLLQPEVISYTVHPLPSSQPPHSSSGQRLRWPKLAVFVHPFAEPRTRSASKLAASARPYVCLVFLLLTFHAKINQQIITRRSGALLTVMITLSTAIFHVLRLLLLFFTATQS